MRAYVGKYIKAKVKELNGMIKANFAGYEIPKENVHQAYITCVTIDSVMNLILNSCNSFLR